MTLLDLGIDLRTHDAALEATLTPYLRFDWTSLAIVPRARWAEATAEQKVLLYLLARRAMVALELVPSDYASSIHIERQIGMPGGTVRPALMKLTRQRLVVKVPGGYRIPEYAVSEIAARFGVAYGA